MVRIRNGDVLGYLAAQPHALTVRSLALSLCAVILLAGCSAEGPSVPAEQSSSTSTRATPAPVNPERIRRVRADMPTGYEIAGIGGYASTPVAFWGFGRGYTVDPAQCGALADPAPDGPASGLSASGPGGIIYVVVVTGPVGPVGFDPVLLSECRQWTMAYGSASADVSLIDAPAIDGAATLGLAGVIRNVVESGTETGSRADTFMAYLGDHVVFVTLITDPGSVEPPLAPQFASDLLVQTVATLRSE
ncbi:DUF5642 family protein [soil metagenome]